MNNKTNMLIKTCTVYSTTCFMGHEMEFYEY